MNSGAIAESVVERIAVAWLESSDRRFRNGAEIAPGEAGADALGRTA